MYFPLYQRSKVLIWLKVNLADLVELSYYHIETSQLISFAYQLTGFFIMVSLAFNDLRKLIGLGRLNKTDFLLTHFVLFLFISTLSSILQ